MSCPSSAHPLLLKLGLQKWFPALRVGNLWRKSVKFLLTGVQPSLSLFLSSLDSILFCSLQSFSLACFLFFSAATALQ